MQIIKINVPFYVNYINDWNEIFQSINFNGHIIINKIVTGCGFTEYFLNNNIPTILCSPRKVLLENKHQQHSFTTFLVKNSLEKWIFVDQDFTGSEKSSIKNDDEIIDDTNYLLSLKDEIINYINYSVINNIPPKILVTYDSLKHVLEAIYNSNYSLTQFQVVVDEFQSIFTDASFKATTELNFMGYLQNVPNVCYLSATPVLDKYLEELDEFKNLPYYELVWDKRRLREYDVDRQPTKNLSGSCCEIIEDYLKGEFPTECLDGKNLLESKEVVFYINSIAEIKKIIKKINKDTKRLTPLNTNIICSDNKKNEIKLKQLGFNIGTVPLKGDPHKMFTFCTRTVYLGADFYSTNASTVICSDCNIDCLALDISQDLPQIMGRQRLEENVFRNRAILFYKERKDNITKEEFDLKINQKINATLETLHTYSKMDEVGKRRHNIIYRDRALLMKYKDDYVGIQDSTCSATYNKLVELRDRRSWEIKEQYKDGLALYYAMSDEGFRVNEYISKRKLVFDTFFKEFFKDKLFSRRMKLYCEFVDNELGGNCGCLRNTKIPKSFHLYYTFIGSQKIRSVSFQESFLKDIIKDAKKRFGDPLLDEINNAFTVGDRLPLQDIKKKLIEIYQKIGVTQKAKATDIQLFFEVKEISFKERGTGKRIKGYVLLDKKEINL